MNLEEKREALIKMKPSNGWKEKVAKMNGREITKLYQKMDRDGKLVEE